MNPRETQENPYTLRAARTLAGALPWLMKYHGKVLVVKYGGNAMIDDELKQAFAEDIAFLRYAGFKPVVVHGGGPQISKMLDKLGIESEFKGGLRVTTPEAMDVVRMVLVGQVQRELVGLINRHGHIAVGLSGEDAGLLTVTPVDSAFGFVGNVTQVRAELIHRLLDDGLTPVISTIGANAQGQPYNVNADEAARAIAVAMSAEKIVYLTAVPGLLEDSSDENTLIPRLTSAELRERISHESVGKGMIPKLRACADAVDQGVGFAHIIDGRVHHSLLIELLTDHGVGTMIKREKSW
jgi:acetylglutamate kinase